MYIFTSPRSLNMSCNISFFMSEKIKRVLKRMASAATLAAVLTAAALSLAACGADREKEDATVEADYDLSVSVERDLKRIYVTQTVTVNNCTSDALNKLVFAAYSFAYEHGQDPDAFYAYRHKDAESKGETLIGSVSVNGLPAENQRNGIYLSVSLPEPLQSGGKAVVKMAYTLKVPVSSDLRYGLSGKVLKLTDFHFILAPYSSGWLTEDFVRIAPARRLRDYSDYTVRYYLPENVSIATNMPIKSVTRDNGTQTVECDKACLSEAGCVVYGDMRGISCQGAQALFSDSDEIVSAASVAMNACRAAIGDFPFMSLSVVSVPLAEDSVCIPGLIMINDALSDDRLAETVYEGVSEQYFGIAVGAENDCDYWASFGTGYYLSKYLYSVTGEQSRYDGAVSSDRAITATYAGEMAKYYPGYVLKAGRSLGLMLNTEEYLVTVCCLSAVTYDGLRQQYGDKKLKRALKTLYESCRYGRVSTSQAIEILCAETGRAARSYLTEAVVG